MGAALLGHLEVWVITAGGLGLLATNLLPEYRTRRGRRP